MTALCMAICWMLAAAPDPGTGLQALTVDAGKLSPGFSTARTAYVVHVGHSVESLHPTATPEDPAATVTVTGGTALEVGRNIVTIDVAAPNGKSTYTLKIFRDHPTPNWVKVTGTTPFPARDSAGELVFNGRMWILGGFIPKVISDVWSSQDGKNWTAEGQIPSEAGVNIPVNIVHDGKMWVTCNDGTLYSSADGKDWTQVTALPPWGKRYAPGSAEFAGKMWILGGKSGGTLYNDVWSSTNGIDWTCETETAPWSRRQLFGQVQAFNDKLWVLGGGVTIYHPFKAYNDVWSSPDGREWTRVLDEAPWPGRIWSTSAVYRDRLWLLGGFQAEPVWQNFNDVWYSPDGKQWHRFETETTWSARHELSALVYDGKLWVIAGNEWPLLNDVWYLDIPGLSFVTQPVLEEFLNAEYTYRARADFGS
ncbi:MAG: cadherin-like beta sandwich domain-containing protein, partial [FCB group bacterium]|nr:cadherin-like beta sandwich domain-containing protein [FCB group bacterium]